MELNRHERVGAESYATFWDDVTLSPIAAEVAREDAHDNLVNPDEDERPGDGTADDE